MKLVILYTEEPISEVKNPFKKLLSRTSKIFSKAKQTPNPRIAKVKKIIQEVYQEIWSDYYDNSKALRRIDSYVHSIEQNLPYLIQIQDEEDLRREIEMMFRARAERIIPIKFDGRTYKR